MNDTLKASTAAVAQVMLALTLTSPPTSAQSTTHGPGNTQRPPINSSFDEQTEKMILDSTSRLGIDYFFAADPFVLTETTQDDLYSFFPQKNKSLSTWLGFISTITNIEANATTFNNTSNTLINKIDSDSYLLAFDSPFHRLSPQAELTSGTSAHTSDWIQNLSEILENNATRETTLNEQIAGEIRSWALLDQNWDGEGALKPMHESLEDAAIFARLLDAQDPMPTPMLHATGHAGLFWETNSIYADIEFLENHRIAYFIDHGPQGRHKGVLEFTQKALPPVLSLLLFS